MFKLDLEKAEEPDINANIHWIIEKAREFQKNTYFCFIDYAKAFDCVDHNKLWKILQEMGIPDHLICLLSNLYAGQEATVRTRQGTTDWFQIGKGVCPGCILSSWLFNLYAEYIMRNARLDEAQAEIPEKLPGEISITLDMQMIPSSWQKVKRNWRASDESERREWKAGLKRNIQKNNIMASGPIISWQIDGETMDTVTDFILGGSKITVDSDRSHEIKRHLLLWQKAMTNLDSILKSRDITLLTKVHLVKVMVFPVIMCECESWTIKKAERWRIDVFELWRLRRLLRVPWTARSNQSILK